MFDAHWVVVRSFLLGGVCGNVDVVILSDRPKGVCIILDRCGRFRTSRDDEPATDGPTIDS